MAEIRTKSRQFRRETVAQHGAYRERGAHVVSVAIVWSARRTLRNTTLPAKAVRNVARTSTANHHRRPLRRQRRSSDVGSQ